MRIGLMVNNVQTEQAVYTTMRLAMRAINQGHEAWVIGAGDFIYDTDEKIHAWGSSVSKKNYKSGEVFINELQGPKARRERITVDSDIFFRVS